MELKEIDKKTFLGKGNMSKCYLLENGNVLKLFNNKRSVYELGRFEYFLKYDNESFIFPFEFIYDSTYFYGYITRFAKGLPLEEVFSKSNLLDLANNSVKLEKNIDFVSQGGITLYDFHERNLLYDGNKYSAIDFDETGTNVNKESARIINQEAHRILIHNLFLDNLERNKNTRFILDKLSSYKAMYMKPSEIMFRIKNDMDKFYKEDINTLEDVQRIIRR